MPAASLSLRETVTRTVKMTTKPPAWPIVPITSQSQVSAGASSMPTVRMSHETQIVRVGTMGGVNRASSGTVKAPMMPAPWNSDARAPAAAASRPSSSAVRVGSQVVSP